MPFWSKWWIQGVSITCFYSRILRHLQEVVAVMLLSENSSADIVKQDIMSLFRDWIIEKPTRFWSFDPWLSASIVNEDSILAESYVAHLFSYGHIMKGKIPLLFILVGLSKLHFVQTSKQGLEHFYSVSLRLKMWLVSTYGECTYCVPKVLEQAVSERKSRGNKICLYCSKRCCCLCGVIVDVNGRLVLI